MSLAWRMPLLVTGFGLGVGAPLSEGGWWGWLLEGKQPNCCFRLFRQLGKELIIGLRGRLGQTGKPACMPQLTCNPDKEQSS